MENTQVLPSQSLASLLSQRQPSPTSTSISELDRVLNGGILPGQIYELSSLNGTGRLQFAQNLCINAMKMGRNVLWISCVKEVQAGSWIKKVNDFNSHRDETIDGDTSNTAENPLERFQTIRITTLAKLYLYLQCVLLKQKHHNLVIIEDLSIILHKNISDLNPIVTAKIPNVKKRANFLELKKHKSLKDIFKLLKVFSSHCKASVCIMSSMDTKNMSFIETPTEINTNNQHKERYNTNNPNISITNSSQLSSSVINHPSHPLSSEITNSPFNSSQMFPPPPIKPKVFYQQILTSALGDHPSWRMFMRARLTFYKDWIPLSNRTKSKSKTRKGKGGKEVGCFVHVRHNPVAIKNLSQNNDHLKNTGNTHPDHGKVRNLPIYFEIEEDEEGEVFGIKAHDEDEKEETDDHDDDELEDESSLSQVPFVVNDEDLESDFAVDEEEEQGEAVPLEEIDQDDRNINTENSVIIPSSPHKDIRNVKEMMKEIREESQSMSNSNEIDEEVINEISTTQEEEEEEEDEEEEHEEEENHHNGERSKENEETYEHNNNDNDDKHPELTNDNTTYSIELDYTEIEEMNDELEELYPTQPEVLTIEELTQLSQSIRPHTTPFTQTDNALSFQKSVLYKKQKLTTQLKMHEKTENSPEEVQDQIDQQLDLVPSSAPLF